MASSSATGFSKSRKWRMAAFGAAVFRRRQILPERGARLRRFP
ncbi:unnamed protein product [Acidocella sp. C78]|nr:unnamed protein product [Acidocella sp. C78]